MEKATESSIEIGETEGEGYMDLSFSRAPKKNHDALAQLGKRYEQWLKQHGVSSKIYYLNNTTSNEVPPEGLENMAKTLSVREDDEELWVAMQFYRDKAHADQVRSNMTQDQGVGAIMREFDSLVSQGKNLITGGFSRLTT